MLLSIIIPVYNGSEYELKNCLDSIFFQNLDPSDFEVIVVDDCSSSSETIETLFNYKSSNSLDNLTVISHSLNKHQGGARNTGINLAKGKFVQFIDHDDLFNKDSLSILLNFIRDNENLDIFMTDYLCVDVDKNEFSEHNFQKNLTNLLTGESFLISAQIAWEVWSYCFNLNFLIENKIYFIEEVRFEDLDFVLRALTIAKQVRFLPIVTIIHVFNSKQTTIIGSDNSKISEIAFLNFRLRLLYYELKDNFPQGANEIMHQHQFCCYIAIIRYYWRLQPSVFLDLAQKYPPYTPSKFKLTNFVYKYPKLFIYTCVSLRPFLFLARKFF